MDHLEEDIAEMLDRLDTLHENHRAFLTANRSIRDRTALRASLAQFERDNNTEVAAFTKLREDIGDLTGRAHDELKKVQMLEDLSKQLGKSYNRLRQDSKDLRELLHKARGGARKTMRRGRRGLTRRR